jgi:hypothetical protein
LNTLRRWAAGKNVFTLDFGDHEDDYVKCATNESEAISQLIAGYVDIMLKQRSMFPLYFTSFKIKKKEVKAYSYKNMQKVQFRILLLLPLSLPLPLP